tara:strand:+ start:165 stop:1235 length:1071 start_codon:yes stop_codon:yes gene_type:complete
MSRVLRRPMFRGGGKIDSRGTGITSGLEDRKGFQNGGIDLGRVQSESEKLFELQKSMGLFDRPERKTLFGLGAPEFLALAQRGFEFAGKGGDQTLGQKLASTAADTLGDIGAIKQTQRKEDLEKDKLEKAIKAGNIEAVYGQLGKEAIQKAKSEGTGYQIEKKIELIGTLNSEISALEDQIKDATGDSKIELQRQLDTKKDQLGVLVKEYDVVVSEFLKSDEGEYLFGDISEELQRENNPATNEDWETTDPGFYAEVMKRVREALLPTGMKKGGRVKMQQGGMTTQTTQPTQQPETLALSFADLRARLPQEITNDIVALVSQSNQALSDFANIRTQADVDNFNKKYGVNLVLPQEA